MKVVNTVISLTVGVLLGLTSLIGLNSYKESQIKPDDKPHALVLVVHLSGMKNPMIHAEKFPNLEACGVEFQKQLKHLKMFAESADDNLQYAAIRCVPLQAFPPVK